MHADKQINFYESDHLPGLQQVTGWERKNTYNPYGLVTDIRISIIDEYEYLKMRDSIKQENKKVSLDNHMIVFEGCDQDDKIVLGGRVPFLSHFCTLFTFNICYTPGEESFIKRESRRFNNPDDLDKNLDSFLNSFDKKF
mmetsp:Transcript_15680/g.26447  ORF Transcript_15680/g.26447 Transcript_15680/m.26447 type:complete len:140 (+) Transcript_15680:439-858(+)